MAQRYWVIGGDYRDCGFADIVPGTEQIAGPFGDEQRAKTEWTRLTFRDHCAASRRFTIAVEDRRG